MNKRKLENLAKKLETLPRKNFEMGEWARVKVNHRNYDDRNSAIKLEKGLPASVKHHTCGTTCCIAGYQVIRTPGRFIENLKVFSKKECLGHPEDVARKELGLTHSEAVSLFYEGAWPKKLSKYGYTVPMFKSTPKGAAKRIRYFITTGE